MPCMTIPQPMGEMLINDLDFLFLYIPAFQASINVKIPVITPRTLNVANMSEAMLRPISCFHNLCGLLGTFAWGPAKWGWGLDGRGFPPIILFAPGSGGGFGGEATE